MEANSSANGNGQRDDQGAAHIAEEQEQDDRHQDDASVRLCSTVCVV